MAKPQTISAPIAAPTGDDATRKALVVAAFRLFAMEGVGAVSLRRITASAGAANQSAIHYHFSNRLGLVRAVLDHVNDKTTLKNYKDNKVRIGGGISADHVADMILFAYNMPQNVLIQEMVVTPTRQEY